MTKSRIWLLAIILAGLALRLYNLTYHSLWFDEAISVHWARQGVPRILEVGFTLVEDRLPPLYYLMLKGWAGLFGFSEASVRGLSVLFGVTLIPVVANLGTMLFNRRVGLSAALLIALNPFLIWYAQEARMYAPAVFFSTLLVWAWLRLAESVNVRMAATADDKGTRTRFQNENLFSATTFSEAVSRPLFFFILFILSAIAGLYTHLYTAFLLPVLGLWLIISYPRKRRLWVLFAAGGLLITVIFAPLAIAIWRFSGEAAPGDPLSGIGQRAWWLLQSFTIWKASLVPALAAVIPATVILFVVAAYLKPPNKDSASNSQRQIPRPRLLATLLLVSPFAIANLLLLRNHLAFFGERYFVVMVPWLLLLAAVGADRLRQWIHPRRRILLRAQATKDERSREHGMLSAFHASRIVSYLPISFLLIITAVPIPGQWSIPAAKEAWRQSVAYLADSATPADGILIHPDWVRYPFQFYFEGPGQTYAAFSNVTQETALDGPLQGVIDDHAVVWLIQSHVDGPDPGRRVERWFASRYPLVTELYPPGVSLKGYATDYQIDRLPPEATPTDLQFENGLKLIGYQADRIATAIDPLFHPPSGWLHVTLYWTTTQPITTVVTPIVQLVGPDGVWGINLERANDALDLYPPTRWPATSGERIIVRHDLDVNLNPMTPPGTYQLQLSLQEEAGRHTLTEIKIR